MGMGMHPGNGYPPPPMAMGPPAPVIMMHHGPSFAGGFGGTHCMSCGTITESIPRKTLGCTAVAWIIVLLFTVPIISCIPCCSDGCKDTEVVCTRCGFIKNMIPAHCCG